MTTFDKFAVVLIGSLLTAGAFVADAKGKSRTLTSPETAFQIRGLNIRPESCKNVAKQADGGVCKPHFVLTVSACALGVDGGISDVCSSATLPVDGKSAAVKELWDAARPVWEKSSGF